MANSNPDCPLPSCVFQSPGSPLGVPQLGGESSFPFLAQLELLCPIPEHIGPRWLSGKQEGFSPAYSDLYIHIHKVGQFPQMKKISYCFTHPPPSPLLLTLRCVLMFIDYLIPFSCMIAHLTIAKESLAFLKTPIFFEGRILFYHTDVHGMLRALIGADVV